jgi:hypothetical protein
MGVAPGWGSRYLDRITRLRHSRRVGFEWCVYLSVAVVVCVCLSPSLCVTRCVCPVIACASVFLCLWVSVSVSVSGCAARSLCLPLSLCLSCLSVALSLCLPLSPSVSLSPSFSPCPCCAVRQHAGISCPLVGTCDRHHRMVALNSIISIIIARCITTASHTMHTLQCHHGAQTRCINSRRNALRARDRHAKNHGRRCARSDAAVPCRWTRAAPWRPCIRWHATAHSVRVNRAKCARRQAAGRARWAGCTRLVVVVFSGRGRRREYCTIKAPRRNISGGWLPSGRRLGNLSGASRAGPPPARLCVHARAGVRILPS